ncbi:MAG: hypothetical protein LBB04_00190 [Oscillospiraceae bacterium]|nr:hypothetical protein [Oscillospiraceae bacterium]
MLEEKVETSGIYKIPELTANYKVTVENYISFNLLLIGERIRRGKKAATRNFLLMTLLVSAMFVMGIKSKAVALVLIILWSLVLLSFVQGLTLKKQLVASAKKGYSKDNYSRYSVELEFYEDRLVEIAPDPNVILFDDVELVFEDETIFAIYSKKKRTFIIPKCEETKKILEKLTTLKAATGASLVNPQQVGLIRNVTPNELEK